ncbi:MAG TPA: class I SAM-dependent methyltransferase [Acidimicrobiia bacterium]|jgi:SAM-dependent methyltransferase
MGLRKQLFALTYNRQMAKVERAGLRARRQDLLGRASGTVLEIGAGTGANLDHYGPGVVSLTLTEPERPMLRRLQQRAERESPAPTVLRAPAEDLPYDDDSFDVVVSTLVLCGVNDQPRSLREIHRVLRPGGRLLFIEHVRADDDRLARRQDRMNGVSRFIAGCDCNRSTLDTIERAGYSVTEVEHTELPKAPSFVRPLIVGAATKVPGARFDAETADDRAATATTSKFRV